MRHLAAAVLLAAPLLHGQCGETVTLGTLGPGAEYGAAVAVDGDTLVVGAPGVDAVVVQSWNGDGWTTIATFSGQAGSRYGSAVALADGIAIVGAPFHDEPGLADTGAVQLLVEGPPGTWSAGPLVLHPNPQASATFGLDVDTDGQRAIVGAPGQNADKGNVRVYDVSGGALTLTQGLPAPAVIGTGDLRWGTSVAVDGPNLVVGAPNGDAGGFVDNGAAAFYRANGVGTFQYVTFWTFSGNGVRFGIGVDVDGDRAVGRGTNNFGAALFVEYDGFTWTNEVSYLLFDADESISISGERCLAGRPDNGVLGATPGGFAFPTFDGATWGAPVNVVTSLAHPTNRFGEAVSLSGDRGVVGAPFDATAGLDAGAVYTYDTSLIGWQTDFVSNTGIASGSFGTPLNSTSGSWCGDDAYRMRLSFARPNALATLVVGLSELSAPFKGGVLVPTPDVVIPGLPTDPQGVVELEGTWPAGLPAGTPLWFQWFVVDPDTPKGLSATSARVVTTPTPAP